MKKMSSTNNTHVTTELARDLLPSIVKFFEVAKIIIPWKEQNSLILNHNKTRSEVKKQLKNLLTNAESNND